MQVLKRLILPPERVFPENINLGTLNVPEFKQAIETVFSPLEVEANPEQNEGDPEPSLVPGEKVGHARTASAALIVVGEPTPLEAFEKVTARGQEHFKTSVKKTIKKLAEDMETAGS